VTVTATAAATPAVELRGVTFAYGRRPVVRDIELIVRRQTFTALIGPNGGGKSTLLKLALGLLEPDRGTVRLLGDRPERTRRRVGYLPQSLPQDLDFPITVRDAVGHGRLGGGHRWGPFGGGDRRAIMAALQETGTADLADRPLSRLSGGQRQRVLIARALVTSPELLILDEPAAGLDPTSQSELYDLLSRLARRLSVLVVSHHMSLVSHHVQQVVCVHDGHLHVPDTAEIGPELAAFFPDVQNMVLVRHEHDDCPPHEEPPCEEPPHE
jgi:zinc transport system ATP-binding protein